MKLHTLSAAILLSASLLSTSLAQEEKPLLSVAIKSITQSDKLSMAELCKTAHELTKAYPEQAHQILELTLNSRPSWSERDLISVFGAIECALPKTHASYKRANKAVAESISTGKINEDAIQDEMGIKLLHTLTTSPSIRAEQYPIIGPIIAADINSRRANDYLVPATNDNQIFDRDFNTSLTQPKENPRYEDIEIPNPGPVTPNN